LKAGTITEIKIGSAFSAEFEIIPVVSLLI
jgi:hypothetical protein